MSKLDEIPHSLDCEAGNATLATPAPCSCVRADLLAVVDAAEKYADLLGEDDDAAMYAYNRMIDALARVTGELPGGAT